MDAIEKIAFIGAGNVATHLAMAFAASGKQIIQIYSRTVKSAQILAAKLNCEYTNNFDQITDHADLYIFSVPDDTLESFINSFPYQNKFLAHTAGSIAMEVLATKSNRTGVFYPLQTFSKNVEVDLRKVPVCVEANNPEDALRLEKLASHISDNVCLIDSATRETLHIAAVFACNFTNHLFVHSETILKQRGIPLSMLLPLITETIRKTSLGKPSDFQTGPAVRGDKKTLDKHIVKLEQLPESQKIYTFISESIINLHKKKPDNIS